MRYTPYQSTFVCTITTIALAAALLPRVLIAQDLVNSMLLFDAEPSTTLSFEDGLAKLAVDGVPQGEVLVNAKFLGRAAAVGDSVRLADFAGDGFLPAAIPVAGQPYFDSPARANLQGSGSAVAVSAIGQVTESGLVAGAAAQLLVNNATLASTDSTAGANVTIQQAFASFDRLRIGLMESAFADPAAIPDTLDVAGPNARITIFPAGLGAGQGRLSCDFFADTDKQTGFEMTLSLEQPTPRIATDMTLDTYSRTPDFVSVFKYVEGEKVCGKFQEIWHLQFGTLFRNLGLENSTNTFEQDEFGYGLSLSGALRFPVNPRLQVLDRVCFSVTYGEGISRYITDLNAAPDTNDAVVNTSNVLETHPVLAWYAGYTHNWTDYLRSTVTYSRVDLDSVAPLALPTVSPYRVGEYVGINLLYHEPFQTNPEKPKDHNFYTGIEYLYGKKETLNGAEGDAHRLMWLVAISN